MSKRRKGKYWSASLLKSRGWTNELIRELLPKPRYFSNGGNSVRVWERAVVLKAEENARFRACSVGTVTNKTRTRELQSAAERVAETLSNVWDKTEIDEDLAWTLAAHYHCAILERLKTIADGRVIRPSQARAYLNQFLTFEKGCLQQRLPDDLKNFVRAAPWLEENASDPLAEQVRTQYPLLLKAAAFRTIGDFSGSQPEAALETFLGHSEFPYARLLKEPLSTVYSVWYVPMAIRSSLELLVALNPKDEYPEARAMKRHFVLHLGGTNTGKTYAGFQRLIRAETGVYLAPLRLLALEAQETLLDAGVDCGLTTGEEEDLSEEDTHVAATAEKLNLKQRYEVAVIDECQMIADNQRGYAWTRAILGVLAPEIHLCAAPEAKHILIRLIESCGDSYEVEIHQRRVPLLCMRHEIDFEQVKPGDALITFSKVGVLSVAEDLRQSGKEPAIIYGALPYATRRRQMEGFLEGRMDYVVSTDAIGMGLNLPIRRILFMDTEKFDGVERRALKPEEIQQIAGRAGRYGMYDRGYVGAMQNLGFIRAGLDTVVPPIQYAVAGFSDLVLQVDFDLLEVLTEWNKMPTAEPYVKLDISRYIALISKIREFGFTLPKEQELRAANIPFDETEDALRDLFFHFLRQVQQSGTIEPPELPEQSSHTLPELEQYYRKLDLYFSFAKAFNCEVDEDRLHEARDRVAEEINEILLHRLRNNIRFCERCGKALPLHYRGRLCNNCYRRTGKQSQKRQHS